MAPANAALLLVALLLAALLLAALFVFIAAAPPAGAASPAERFVEETATRIEALRSRATSQHKAGCTSLYKQVFDLDSLARATAGEHWQAMGDTGRRALRQALEQRLANECLNLLKRPDLGAPVIRRSISRGQVEKVTVQHIGDDGRVSTVIWSLVSGGPLSMRAIDAVGDGRGLAAALRADFEGAVLGAGGDIQKAISQFSVSR